MMVSSGKSPLEYKWKSDGNVFFLAKSPEAPTTTIDSKLSFGFGEVPSRSDELAVDKIFFVVVMMFSFSEVDNSGFWFMSVTMMDPNPSMVFAMCSDLVRQ